MAKIIVDKLLEEALVPVAEQPYKVPKNWVWVYSTYLFDIKYGKNLPISKFQEDGYPVFGANGQIGYYDEYNYEDSKILVSCRGANSGRINVSLPKSFITNNSLILNEKLNMSNSFIKYLFESRDKSALISGTAQPQITLKAFSNFPLLLLPKPEQQRIEYKVELLLSKIDKAKELIEESRGEFENRKSAILEKAFRGELSEQWRKENDSIKVENKLEICSDGGFFKLPKSWYWIKSIDVFHERPRNGYSPRSTEEPQKYKTLKLGAITNGYFNENEIKYIYEDIPDDSRLWLMKGDFLIQRANSIDYVGISAIYSGEDKEYIYPDLIMRGRINNDIIYSDLAVKYINSYYGRSYFVNNATGTAGNMPKINQKVVGNLPIPIPPLEEQKEIVRILDNLLSFESEIEELTQLEDQIELLKKSILAKAFRGELGTNDPTEDSAIELLKETLKEKTK